MEIKTKTITVPKTEHEKANEELTKGRVSSYKLKETEANYVHVELERVVFAGPEKVSRPIVDIYDLRTWNSLRFRLPLMGFNHIKIIHAPKGVDTKTTKPAPKK